MKTTIMNKFIIPNATQVGGVRIEVEQVERVDDNCIGQCHLLTGKIEIANMANKSDHQCYDSKVNTFFHELTHAILGTIRKKELNNDEEFVCVFSSLLTEAVRNFEYKEEATCICK